MPSGRGKERLEHIPAASLQLRLPPDSIPWIFASLMNEPQLDLYNGEFPEPFTQLSYQVHHRQGKLVLLAVLGVGEEFNTRYGNTVGSPDDLAPFLHRYPNSHPDGNAWIIRKKDGQTQGIIGRVENQIVIQRGGEAGQIALDSNVPVNDLSLQLDGFNLLVQRYVGAIWKASSETDQKQLQLVLSIPAVPEGAPATYFSTFEILAKEFRGRPRLLDLYENIGGYQKIKNEIRGLIMDITRPDISRRFGSHPFSNRFFLVSGDEGTGKSLLPKAIDTMLRSHFGSEKFEHYRLHLQDILRRYGAATAAVVKTILDHIRENEKKGIPTLLHLDNLHTLVPPGQRFKTNGNSLFSGMSIVSPNELAVYQQGVEPVIGVLRQFGTDLGGESRWTIVYGESRARRDELPEDVARTFRRAFHLSPDLADLEDIFRVQIAYTRIFAERTGYDPFIPTILQEIPLMAQTAIGLVGRDIQQALMSVIARNKAEWNGNEDDLPQIAPEKVCEELRRMSLARGIEGGQRNQLGYNLSSTKSK